MAGEDTTVEEESARFSIKRFLREVQSEMKKVSWPTKKELVSYTGIVFVAVAFVCVLIWAYDALFTKLLEVILR